MSNPNAALVTGVSAGIGAACGDRLARCSHDLILAAPDEIRLNTLAERLRAETSIRVQAVLPGATCTKLWGKAGIDITTMPSDQLMDVDEMVALALTSLDMGEPVTIPFLPDIADWSRFNDVRLAMGPNLSVAHAAERYKRAGHAA